MSKPDQLRIEISHRDGEDAVVVAPRGEIDAANAAAVRAGIESGVSLAGERGVGLVVVDMTRVGFCGSAGLAALVVCQRLARERGQDLVVVAEEEGVVENVLIVSGLISMLTVRISLDHAFQAHRLRGGARRADGFVEPRKR